MIVRDARRVESENTPWAAWLTERGDIGGGSLVTGRREPVSEPEIAPRGTGLDPVHVTRCQRWMPVAGEPCARLEGHRDCCRTRAVLDYDRDDRRIRKARRNDDGHVITGTPDNRNVTTSSSGVPQ